MRYACYHLVIDSEIALPELRPAPEDDSRPADLTVRRATLGQDGEAVGDRRGPHLWMAERAMWLRVPGVARYQVEDGRRILVDPEPGIDEDSVRLFMLGSALGAALAQRGLMVLHGNALRVGDGCMICVGPSGAGKSTLAAALMQRGFEVLADDVVAIDADGRALPGLPRIKLWSDAASRLAVDTEGLARVRPAFDKFNLPLATAGSQASVPVRWIYLLQPHQGDDIRIEPVQGVQRFMLLQRNLYRARILRAQSPQQEHLALSGRIASAAHIAQVQRPIEGFAIDELVEALLADAAAHR